MVKPQNALVSHLLCVLLISDLFINVFSSLPQYSTVLNRACVFIWEMLCGLGRTRRRTKLFIAWCQEKIWWCRWLGSAALLLALLLFELSLAAGSSYSSFAAKKWKQFLEPCLLSSTLLHTTADAVVVSSFAFAGHPMRDINYSALLLSEKYISLCRLLSRPPAINCRATEIKLESASKVLQ